MAKGDHVVALAKAALENNRAQVRRICEMIVANEPEKSSLKDNLYRMMNRIPKALDVAMEMLPVGLKGLVIPIEPKMDMEDIELPPEVLRDLGNFFEENAHAPMIHESGLSVPHKILLSGPPGNGKTTLAGAIALKLGLPFLVGDLSVLIASHLGESGKNFSTAMRAAAEKPCVLFLDEMETVLAERSGLKNSTDVGEVKRLVSTVLLEIDRLPDHVILIGATNHDELLDRAVVRRFDFHWSLPAPNQTMVDGWRARFAKRYPEIPILSLMPPVKAEGQSLSDIERDAKKWCRQWLIANTKQAAAA